MSWSGMGKHARTTLIWWIAIFLFVLPAVLGSLSSVVAVLGALVLAPAVIGRGSLRDVSFTVAGGIFLAVFVALVVAFAITARDPGNVLYALDFLAFPLTLVVALALADRPLREIGRLLPAFCAIGGVIAFAVALNDVFLLRLPRAVGFIAGGNLLGRVSIMLGAISLAGPLLEQSARRYWYIGGFIAAFAAAFLTGSRGAAIALPALVAIFSGFLVTLPGARRPYVQIAVMLAGMAATALLLSTAMGVARYDGIFGTALEAVRGAGVSDAAAVERLKMYAVALSAFQASPWVGYGWANLGTAAAPFMDMSLYGGPASSSFQYHSDLANFAVAAGVVGIGCWLALLAAPLAGALAGPRGPLFRVRLYCGAQLSIGCATLGLTDITLGYDLTTTLYAFLAAVVLAAFRDEPAAAG